MGKTPRNSSGNKASSRRQQSGGGGGAANSSSSRPPLAKQRSNYHSLESIISSESRDDGETADGDDSLSRGMNLLDKEETYHYSVSDESGGSRDAPEVEEEESRDSLMSSAHETPMARMRYRGIGTLSGSGSNRGLEPPPPPPLSPGPTSSLQTPRGATAATVVSSSPSDPTSQQQKNALLSLLTEMRAMEQKLQRQSSEYASERAALTQSMEQQSQYITQLEHSQQSLQRDNDTLKKALSNILLKLERFATGCWKFNSASVKKMSEALHVQVHEWSRRHSIDTNSSYSKEEREAMEQSALEKVQSMHLEIRELKDKNRELKEKMIRARERKAERGGGGGGGGGRGISTALSSDDISQFSGVTQMTTATAFTALTVGTNAMAGLLNGQDCEAGTPPLTLSASSSSAASYCKSKQIKKTVHISSPPSILKQTSKYDQRANGQSRVRLQQHKEKQPMNQQQKSRQVKAQAVVRHDRPPKSPKMTRTSTNSTATKNNATLFLQTGFANFEEGFANFDDENGNGTSLQWVSGDEESEV